MTQKFATSRRKDGSKYVHPVAKKKPFGVPRQLAAAEVELLRKNGERARLIKTNRRLDLYAPYEAIIPANADPVQEQQKPVETPIAKPEAKEPEKKIDAAYIRGTEQYRQFEKIVQSKDMLEPVITTSYGDEYLESVDRDHIMLVFTALDEKFDSDAISAFNEGRTGLVPKIPRLEYPPADTMVIRINDGGKAIKEGIDSLLTELRNDTKELPSSLKKSIWKINDLDIVIGKAKDGKVYALIKKNDAWDPVDGKMYIRKVPLDSLSMPEDKYAMFSAAYLTKAIRYGKKLMPKKELYLTTREDYPLTIASSPLAGSDRLPRSGVMLAPKVDDASGRRETRKALNGEEVSA